ncbi:hypothetical protein PHLCEN_2v806 [Hermanssonia centrifuga]|uniref:Uncharacterized protein n=1 Tax=Hermanssonia centrifuga TaxID=98765 RepID=A0A2R6S532_9APHY|nr:hypothetical protein PHLCEN_2v806 [Hermanssonia centrifuga]
MALIPPNPGTDLLDVDESEVCRPEHCFYAFDTLFCALTSYHPLPPQFPDEK